MNELKKLRNEDLISKTKTLVQEERNATLLVIEHLQEIYSRRLHLKCGYSSLHEFLVKELSYSDGAAHRRISAMRLVQDVPEVKSSIAEGKLSLTTASQIQGFFQSEKKSRKKNYAAHEKLELVSRVEGASRQECERRLSEMSPAYCEKPRMISIPEDEELTALLEEYRRLAMLSGGSPQSVIKAALRAAIAQVKAKRARELGRKSTSSEKLLQRSSVQASDRLTRSTPHETKLLQRSNPRAIFQGRSNDRFGGAIRESACIAIQKQAENAERSTI